MSWDVMLFKFAGEPPRTADEIDEPKLLALGAADEVRMGISRILGTVDWSDPTWGIFDGDGFSIEFSVGAHNPIESAMLHVRGGGDAVRAIMALVKPLGWSALDCSTGEFLDPITPSEEGWKGFQKYRDKVLGRGQADSGAGGIDNDVIDRPDEP